MNCRTCVGCTLQGKPCATRDAMKDRLRGLGITSIKWRCQDRAPRYRVGDLAWARTVEASNAGDEYGGPALADFPAVVVRVLGTKALVFIANGASDEHGEYKFTSMNGRGFCKIPLSRLRPREGEPEIICPRCENPASQGHIAGYDCHYALTAAQPSKTAA